MNPVLILTHNNLELTKRCVDSIRSQSERCNIFVVDNGSTDDTPRWLKQQPDITWELHPTNIGVSAGWNAGLRLAFKLHRHCLVIGNDTVLAPWAYRWLMAFDVPFVTGVAVDQMVQLIEPREREEVNIEPHPDFSCFMMWSDCWEKVGPFDERMKLYASDCDFHVRAHRLGIPLVKACVPFYHERSSTLRLAPPAEQIEINAQANEDREVFRKLYNCLPGTKEYEALFL